MIDNDSKDTMQITEILFLNDKNTDGVVTFYYAVMSYICQLEKYILNFL